MQESSHRRQGLLSHLDWAPDLRHLAVRMRRKRRKFRVSRAGNGGVVRPWVAPFVLAMFVLRALVPAGFMLAPVNGGLAIVLCDADATASLDRPAAHDRSAGGMSDGMPGHTMSAADMEDMPGPLSTADRAGHDMSLADMGGHDMPGHQGGHTHPDPTCPYAQSSGATPIPFVAAVTPAIESAPPVFRESTAQTHLHFGPTRQQSPRGPPHLA
jgi:hypothetical protein